MYIQVPVKILRTGDVERDVISGEEYYTYQEEHVSTLVIDSEEINSWYQIVFKSEKDPGDVLTLSTFSGDYPVPYNKLTFEKKLLEQLSVDPDSLGGRSLKIYNFLTRST